MVVPLGCGGSVVMPPAPPSISGASVVVDQAQAATQLCNPLFPTIGPYSQPVRV